MAVAFAEGAVTRLRSEFKLVLPTGEAELLVARLRARTRSLHTQITSVYFDRPGLPLTARARESPEDCLKIRTKEYFPDLGGGARVVVEAKRERNGLTQKQRAWVDRSELRALYDRGELWGRVPVAEPDALAPVLVVTYEREVFQYSRSWRITVDRAVCFHPSSIELALGAARLDVKALPPPFAREPSVIVEVKHLSESLPRWLSALRAARAERFSKFAQGMAHLQATGRSEAGRN